MSGHSQPPERELTAGRLCMPASHPHATMLQALGGVASYALRLLCRCLRTPRRAAQTQTGAVLVSTWRPSALNTAKAGPRLGRPCAGPAVTPHSPHRLWGGRAGPVTRAGCDLGSARARQGETSSGLQVLSHQAGSCASSYALHSAGPLPGQHHDVAALIASKYSLGADSVHAATGVKSGSAGLLPQRPDSGKLQGRPMRGCC